MDRFPVSKWAVCGKTNRLGGTWVHRGTSLHSEFLTQWLKTTILFGGMTHTVVSWQESHHKMPFIILNSSLARLQSIHQTQVFIRYKTQGNCLKILHNLWETSWLKFSCGNFWTWWFTFNRIQEQLKIQLKELWAMLIEPEPPSLPQEKPHWLVQNEGSHWLVTNFVTNKTMYSSIAFNVVINFFEGMFCWILNEEAAISTFTLSVLKKTFQAEKKKINFQGLWNGTLKNIHTVYTTA